MHRHLLPELEPPVLYIFFFCVAVSYLEICFICYLPTLFDARVIKKTREIEKEEEKKQTLKKKKGSQGKATQ